MSRRRAPRNKKAGRAAKYYEEGGPFLSPSSRPAPIPMRHGDEPIEGFRSRATGASPTSPAPSAGASSSTGGRL